MRVAIFGATGPSGQFAVKEALDKGYYVTALVRNPGKLTTKDDKLKVEKVDIFKPEELEPHLKDCDAVVSCLGTNTQGFLGRSRVTFYTDSMKSIVTAMRTSSTKRLVCLTSIGTEKAAGSPWVVEWIFRPLLIGNILSNMAEMEHYLVDHCSDLSYTVVRPSGLADGPSSGKEIKTEENQFVTGASISMPRADVGKFVIDCVQKESWLQKIVAIGLLP
ncbi:flavin reductase (NADPH)-like [Mizuhopecten yessoensis]|uniref:Flavin reductase (NADPH) n=1 Tax=Mizuhopecten yessoensis TaxID=6573 RepID=A0A210PJ65_MIZYE|nr:flavin reductase (NADPH)-like [Mizuhopecten yessoensis]OWF36530.1 Flavin reductase (NADPH) [Mizuhopecten yessoensis]